MDRKIILLVEDNEDDVKLTLNAFKEENIENKVKVINDGEEALDFIFGTGKYEGDEGVSSIAVVLLDIKLPKVDGLEILKRIRADERTKLLPVVILTSSKEEQDIINGYKLGCNSYVRKPVEFDKFSKEVKELGMYWLLINEPPIK
ncbi:MAG: response regulator [Candidatus Tantalella remota]|nr:response regulator [Candidatus Tantalella remota]